MFLDKIKKVAESENVKIGINFKELINKELMLGQSRYVCRYGTLSDGHDKITDSQRYYQAIKEMYTIANEMNMNLARAMDAQADWLEAIEVKKCTESEKLRIKARVLRAETQLENIYITLQDQHRMLDEYNKVRLELKDKVQLQYPQGIEQAEADNWQAVGQYWTFKKQVGANANPLTHLPLDAETKARMGAENNTPELMAWFLVQNKEKIQKIYNGDVKAFIEDVLKVKLLGGKNGT